MNEEVLRKSKDILRDSQEAIAKVAKDFELKIKENPWPYVAGATLFFLGLLIGSSKK